MEKVKVLFILLLFITGCIVYGQGVGLPTRIFNGDEFDSFDVEGDYIAFIGGNKYKDTHKGYFSGDYYGVWIYNINTKELELITNPHDKSIERIVSISDNKVYWREIRVFNSTIYSYDLTTKQEEETKLDVIKYIDNHPRVDIISENGFSVYWQCENDACYQEELWVR